MSPLIDVIFLLLIFYAVTTQFVTDQRLKLDLPDAKTAEEVGMSREERPPIVKIARDGSIWIDDNEISEEDLEAQLTELVQSRPEQTVILKGDEGADYGIVVHVLDIARSVGAKSIQMSADKPPKE
ncbi:MAG: hypothetical protein DRJ61_05155 [Acidobacteria bacterium]|nr:MAG: hypothetical protein DRJ61_05155 [Acidobacteriota bacterium]